MAVVSTIVVGLSISLGLSLSLPLAVVATVSTVVATESVSVRPQTESISVSTIVVGISGSLCLGFRLSGSDGRESENYELEGERELRKCEREKKCILCLVKERGSVF